MTYLVGICDGVLRRRGIPISVSRIKQRSHLWEMVRHQLTEWGAVPSESSAGGVGRDDRYNE